MERIEGGGSFSVCPDTGAVTAEHIVDGVEAAEAAPASDAAPEVQPAQPAKPKKVIPITEVKE